MVIYGVYGGGGPAVEGGRGSALHTMFRDLCESSITLRVIYGVYGRGGSAAVEGGRGIGAGKVARKEHFARRSAVHKKKAFPSVKCHLRACAAA